MLVAQVVRHGLVHLFDGQWRSVRRLQQPPETPGIGLDVPGGDRVVGLDLEVEDRAGIQVQPVANLLGQGELA
ncbi:MAG: hypothetical protein IT501_00490, partial [Rubrivivax sp.]|nr:hypothetical protein [Rubrivivax sp.]